MQAMAVPRQGGPTSLRHATGLRKAALGKRTAISLMRCQGHQKLPWGWEGAAESQSLGGRRRHPQTGRKSKGKMSAKRQLYHTTREAMPVSPLSFPLQTVEKAA